MRLKDYDYSKSGLYFITICIDRLKNPGMMPFGHVENGKMILNDAGKMVEKWYWELENKYPDKRCHKMVIMPNHIHFIIENMPVEMADHADEMVDRNRNHIHTHHHTVRKIKNSMPPLMRPWDGL